MMKAWDDDFSRLQAGHLAQFQDDIPFWIELASSYGSPILELGCGTGRVTLPLLRAGYTVDGLDSHSTVLNRLASRIDEARLDNGHLYHTSMESFTLNQVYPLIIAPCNTLSYLNEDRLCAVLDNVISHLDSPGAFGFDLPNPEYAQKEGVSDSSEPIDTFIDPESGHGCQVFAHQDLTKEPECLSVTWIYDELLPQGEVRRYEATVNHFLRSVSKMDSLLTGAGFGQIEVFGGYDRSPYRISSEHLLFVARSS